MKQWHRGMTLLELLAVLVIIGTIAAIATVAIGNLIDRTRERADEATILSLNQATYYYKLTTNQLFPDTNDDTERIDLLYTLGFINTKPKEQHKDSRFFWDEATGFWCNIVCVNNTLTYDFINNLVDIEGSLNTHPNNWQVEDGFLIGDNGIIFFDNPRSVYTIEVSAQIASGPINGLYGGYGILFETFLSGTNDTGYILQFDRHFGQILIRPRENNREREPILRYDVVLEEDTLVRFEQRFDTDSNRQVRDSQWWLETHVVKLKVTQNEDQKYLSVWINNDLVFQNWSIPTPIAPEDKVINKTGLRAWSNIDVKFYTLNIQE